MQVEPTKTSNVKVEVQGCSNSQQTKEKVPSVAGEWIQVVGKKPNKIANGETNRFVKMALVAPKVISQVSVLYVRFHMRRGIESHLHKEKFSWVNTVLKCIKIDIEVKEKSLIGNAILALYVETENMEKVKEKIRKWSDGADIFISQEQISEFSGQGRFIKEERKVKEINRVTVLCARNPNNNMQVCILANIEPGKHEEIKSTA